jgi:class 3 adenylate cyclase
MSDSGDEVDITGAGEHFPGRNPHPVMRIGDGGTVTYANSPSEPLLAMVGVAVGDRLPEAWRERIESAARAAEPIELKVGPKTFELLAVHLPEHGFTNLYGTDVTAARLVDKFPDLNPNPVLRITEDGDVRYANAASEELRHALGAQVGERLPDSIRQRLFDVLEGRQRELPEVTDRHGTWLLTPIRIPELGLVNVYGTDITAVKALVKFPDANPNPVFRLNWDGTVAYANPASVDLIAGLGGSVGSPLTKTIHEPLLAAARAGSMERLEVESSSRRYELLAVDVPEFGFVNVYGTDVTAVRELELASRENERLLLNILPGPIADRLRGGERLIADRFDDVSLLFADIVEFTRLSSGMAADELVQVLNEVFTVFDHLVDAAGLEKVKTIGDAYMVVGGMSEPRPDHLKLLAGMALDLGRSVESIDSCRRLGMRFRVGIHCGPVVAGVIGTKKFIYDVWGDTVNVASRMESTGIPGRIQVSSVVEARLRNDFRFDARGPTDVKGVGSMSTFFLVGAAT